jgi:Protein of unknown function (DUF1264)
MRLQLSMMPGFSLTTSFADLVALVVRMLTWEPWQPTSARARAGDRSKHTPIAKTIGTRAPIARDLHCPLTFGGDHVPRNRLGNPRVAYQAYQPLNDHVGQCLIFDGPGPEARLIGVEYLVSDEVYRRMSAEERLYWHDRKPDVDAGLVRRSMQSGAEVEATRAPVRTRWGKVYHTWISGGDYPRGPSGPFWSDTGELPFILPPGAPAQLGIR